VKTYTTTTTLSVETKPMGVPGYLVYRCTQEIKTKGRKPKHTTWEGVCKANRKPSPGNECPALGENDGWCLVPQSAIDDLGRHGWYIPKTHGQDEYPISRRSETPFTDLGTEGWILVRSEGGGHMLFDRKNSPLPVARHCDYIEWRMDNGHYDLDKAFKILEARSDIHDLKREKIPYYNTDEDRNETLSFTWAPTVRTYRRAWKWCVENGGEYPSARFPYAVEALNLFGLNKVKNPR